MADDRSASELLSELNEVRGQLQQLREDLGFVAKTLEHGKPIEMPRRVATPEAMEELKTLERREEELWQTYRQKVDL